MVRKKISKLFFRVKEKLKTVDMVLARSVWPEPQQTPTNYGCKCKWLSEQGMTKSR